MDKKDSLKGKKIAIVATDGFEQSELLVPRECLMKAGAEVNVISPKEGRIQGMEHHDKGKTVDVDLTFEDAAADDYDALVLPGGVANPDALRVDKDAVSFVSDFVKSGKPIGAICHGPWTLIEAGGVRGRKMTSWPSLQSDLRNAGAEWVDAEVVVDGGLITSRKPDDLPAFCGKLLETFSQAPAR